MKTLIIIAALLLAQPAVAQSNCAQYVKTKQHLKQKYGETRQLLGLFPSGRMMELYANKETGTWTITSTDPNGVSCMIDSGKDYQAEKPGDPA